MSVSYYQLAVGGSLKVLANLEHLMDVAAAYCAEHKIDESVLLNARLFPDMFPLSRQIQLVSDMTKSCAARLVGQEPPKMEDKETTFTELKARIAKTVSYLQTVTESDFNGAAARDIVLPYRKDKPPMKGDIFLTQHALPNIYFHITTAYNIMRHNGVPVGKGDYLGQVG